MRVPAAGSGDRTEGNVNRQAQEPGARRKRDVGWGRRGGARGAGAPRRPRAVSERCDAGCPARTRAVTDAPRAVAARGTATRLWRLRRAETGKGGSARSTKGAGPESGTSETPGTRRRAPGLTSRGSPSGLVSPASPEEAGWTPGRGGCREPCCLGNGLGLSEQPRLRGELERPSHKCRRTRGAEVTPLPRSEGGALERRVEVYLWTAWKVRARVVLPLWWRVCRSGVGGRWGPRGVTDRRASGASSRVSDS